jgi:LAS superfamily LD-carboxypeptidase LdcB
MQAFAHVAKLARLASLAVALSFLALLGLRPAVGGGTGVRAMGPLPACRYDDILTTPRGYDQWSTTLVDTILRLPSTYTPPDLVKIASLGVPGTGQVRDVIAADLQAMSTAAAAAGSAIGVESAYRSYADQQRVFAKWVTLYGRAQALRISARPGHSEHQLGLTIDFRSDPPVATLNNSWGTTAAGKWMRNHAWEYGFIMSYPKGKSSLTCYDYEPWHFRYVGRDLAALVHASGLTLREYLWANFTTTVVPPPTPKPSVKPTPIPTHPVPTLAPAVTPAASGPPTAAPSQLPLDTPPASLVPADSPAPTIGPISSAPPSPPADNAASIAPALVGGAGIALGTIVLGGLVLTRRRGRSGIGL